MPPAKAKARKRSKPAAAMTSIVPGASTIFSVSLDGRSQTRIQPHDKDVLSGRGGNVNQSPGNILFRAWVAERKHLYALATTKEEKSLIAKQVIQLVYNQNPPGRFLQRDPESPGTGWWYELDEDKILAKTAQALREGAPMIKRSLGSSDSQTQSKKRKFSDKRPATDDDNQEWKEQDHASETPQQSLYSPTAILSSTLPAMSTDLPIYPTKLVRMDYNGTIVRPNDETPPLLPTRSEPLLVPPLSLPTAPRSGGLPRSHSLALSDFSDNEWMMQEFVNPFDNETDKLASLGPIGSLTRLDVIREHSPTLDESSSTKSGQPIDHETNLPESHGHNDDKAVESAGKDGAVDDDHHLFGVRLSIGDDAISRYDACQPFRHHRCYTKFVYLICLLMDSFSSCFSTATSCLASPARTSCSTRLPAAAAAMTFRCSLRQN